MVKAIRLSEDQLSNLLKDMNKKRTPLKESAVHHFARAWRAASPILDGLLDQKSAKPLKYRNTPTVVDGIRFDSKHEAKCWQDLKFREHAGQIRNLQRQVSFPLMVNGKKVQTYRCDFWYWEIRELRDPMKDTTFIMPILRVADAKSAHTANLPAWKRTKLLFESLYGIEVTIL